VKPASNQVERVKGEATMGERAAFATRMQGGVTVWMGPVKRSAALAAGLGLLFSSLASGPAAAQVRPGAAPDPIDRSRGLSGRPMPTVTAPNQPTERLVPESRQREPGTGREIVTPSYYERSTPDGTWQAPPPTSYGAPPGNPTRIPGR
jgi:hypothetical protein